MSIRYWGTVIQDTAAGGFTVSLTGTTHETVDPISSPFGQRKTTGVGSSYGGFWLRADGQIGAGRFGGPLDYGIYDDEWLLPHSDSEADLYSCRWNYVSGYSAPLNWATNVPQNTWTNIQVNRYWTCDTDGNPNLLVTTYITVDIALTSDTSTILDSENIQVWAWMDST